MTLLNIYQTEGYMCIESYMWPVLNSPWGGLGQKNQNSLTTAFRKMMFDQLPYKDLTQQYGSGCWLGKDF